MNSNKHWEDEVNQRDWGWTLSQLENSVISLTSNSILTARNCFVLHTNHFVVSPGVSYPIPIDVFFHYFPGNGSINSSRFGKLLCLYLYKFSSFHILFPPLRTINSTIMSSYKQLLFASSSFSWTSLTLSLVWLTNDELSRVSKIFFKHLGNLNVMKSLFFFFKLPLTSKCRWFECFPSSSSSNISSWMNSIKDL